MALYLLTGITKQGHLQALRRLEEEWAKEPFYIGMIAERLNGTIKNGYLNRWTIQTEAQLFERMEMAVNNYNNRKHQTLKEHGTNNLVILGQPFFHQTSLFFCQ